MIDNLLGIGASFDYFSPIASVIGDLAHGGGYTFTFPACEMTPRDVEKMLRGRGVSTWGLVHVDGTTMLTVRKGQAQWAQHLLEQAGVPVENPPKQARQSRPKRKPEPGGVWSVFDEVFKR